MQLSKVGLVWGLLCLLFGQIPLEARFVRDWSYQQLTKDSDFIAIVEPVSNEDNHDQFEWNPGLAQGISTTFKVLACLKGDASKDKIVLRHFLYKSIIPPNAGSLVNFLVGPLVLKANITRNGKSWPEDFGKVTPRWLVFLKTGPDGAFVPTSGQVDPDSSFRELHGNSFYGTIFTAEP